MENNVDGGMNGMDSSTAMPNNPMASNMNAGNNLPPMEPVVPNTPVMTTKKKSPIVTIFLAILAVLGIGFGVYMYMFGCKCPECKECARCECEECEKCEECPKCENEEVAAEDAYKKYAEGLLNDDSNVFIHLELWTKRVTARLDKNNELYAGMNWEMQGGSLVDSNVVDVQTVRVGNGGSAYLVYTKLDGSVYSVDLVNRETSEVEIMNPVKIENVSRVVRFVESDMDGGYTPRAVDIDGKVIDLDLK